jgi:predicted  nucleic acid-binding Zn-ribbon protein
MTIVKHTCENCDNSFGIKYDEEVCESDPIFCPFCAEMLFLDDANFEDDDI